MSISNRPEDWRPGCRCGRHPPPRGWSPFLCRKGCRHTLRAPSTGPPWYPFPSLPAWQSSNSDRPAPLPSAGETWLARKCDKIRQFVNGAMLAALYVVYSHGTVVPYRSGFMKISLFFKLLLPTPWAPIRTSVFLWNGGILATSS